jgi:hypothetical protein
MTAFFRMIGAAFPNFDAASKVSGFSVTALIVYIGYQIPKPSMYVLISALYFVEGLRATYYPARASALSSRALADFVFALGTRGSYGYTGSIRSLMVSSH